MDKHTNIPRMSKSILCKKWVLMRVRYNVNFMTDD